MDQQKFEMENENNIDAQAQHNEREKKKHPKQRESHYLYSTYFAYRIHLSHAFTLHPTKATEMCVMLFIFSCFYFVITIFRAPIEVMGHFFCAFPVLMIDL